MATAPTAPLGSPTLLLFPTRLEHERFRDQGGLPPGSALQYVSGFGPVAAAARSASLCAALRPARVLLVGIAGSYDIEAHPVGSALEFDAVAVDGIGAGEGDAFLGPGSLGFPQWPGTANGQGAVHEQLELDCARSHGATLLTTCAAAATAREAERRRARFPRAAAEDMEGFAVAVACRLARVPLAIVRGISNRVGDRDPRQWRIPGALAAARRRTLDLLAQHAWGTPEDDG